MAVTLDGVTFQDSDWLNRGHLTTVTVNGTAYQRWEGMWVAGVAEINTKVGQVGGLGVAMAYAAETGSTADAAPGDGKLTWNNATQASATVIYLDAQDANGVDLLTLIDTLDDSTSTIKGSLRVTAVADNSKWIVYAVTAVTSASGYRKLTVSATSYSATSPFADGDALSLSFTRTGDKGDTGTNGDMVGPVSSTDNAWVRWNGTDGTTTQNGTWTESDAGAVTAGGTLDMAGNDLTVDFVTVEAAGENAATAASNLTGDVTLQATGASVINYTLTGDATLLVAGAPTPGKEWQVELRLTQDGVGSRDVTILPANLLTYSEQFDNAAWTKSETTISANAVAAPSGRITADTLVPSTNSASHIVHQTVTISSGATVAATVDAKAAGYTALAVRVGNTAESAAFQATVNLSTGALASSNAYGTGATLTSAAVRDLGDGWYRVTLVGAVAALTSCRLVLYIGNSTPIVNFAGDGASGVYIGGAQLVEGSSPLGYAAVGATRAGQVVWRTAADEIDFAAQAAATKSRILISYEADGQILVDDVSLVS